MPKFLRYFDVNSNGIVEASEFARVFRRDLAAMEAARKTNSGKSFTKKNFFKKILLGHCLLGRKKKSQGILRKRDPGLGWVMDFNNDGTVEPDEVEEAPKTMEKTPKLLPKFEKHEEL